MSLAVPESKSENANAPYLNCAIHKYVDRLIALEHPNTKGGFHDNVVIFMGGLTDGITTVAYTKDLAAALDKIGWGLVEILTQSSFMGFATGTLVRDNSDISSAVKYFTESGKKKIVLAGHSTGSQNVLYYLSQQYEGDAFPLETRPRIWGGICQGGVSDRDALSIVFSPEALEKSVKLAEEYVADGRSTDVLPRKVTAPFFNAFSTAERWISLAKPRGGDDFFSNDLNDDDFAKTFGKVRAPLLIAFGGADQFVPDVVDKEALVDRFKNATPEKFWSKYGGVVPGANHAIDDDAEPGAREEFIKRVIGFLTQEIDIE